MNEGGASVVDCVPEAYLQAAHARLRLAGVRSPRVEAETLAAHVCGAKLRKSTPLKLSPADLDVFVALVERRCQRVPLAHLTGRARFRELDLLVGPGVFVPQPETACLVHWAIGALHTLVAAGHRHPLCVDLCTGSGTIALAIASEVPQASVHAVEVDPGALRWAARNVAHHGIEVMLHHADIANALPEFDGQFDLVTSNPPYVATAEMANVMPEVRDHDPGIALGAGSDGLDIIRSVAQAARRLLRPAGLAAVEHSARQGKSAPALFREAAAWTDIEDHQDHDQLDRFVTAVRV